MEIVTDAEVTGLMELAKIINVGWYIENVEILYIPIIINDEMPHSKEN